MRTGAGGGRGDQSDSAGDGVVCVNGSGDGVIEDCSKFDADRVSW
jgi:hypothetical protein